MLHACFMSLLYILSCFSVLKNFWVIPLDQSSSFSTISLFFFNILSNITFRILMSITITFIFRCSFGFFFKIVFGNHMLLLLICIFRLLFYFLEHIKHTNF